MNHPATHEIPQTIGKPAMRALGNAHITTLKQVVKMTDAELLGLHGLGPKAIKILRKQFWTINFKTVICNTHKPSTKLVTIST